MYLSIHWLWTVLLAGVLSSGRIIELEACIRQVLTVDCYNACLIPTWQDLDVLESMEAALWQLDDFTDMLFGERSSPCLQLSMYYIF